MGVACKPGHIGGRELFGEGLTSLNSELGHDYGYDGVCHRPCYLEGYFSKFF
jgi:hypothetical protein